MFCTTCGNKILQGEKFCTRCGALISKSANDNTIITTRTDNESTCNIKGLTHPGIKWVTIIATLITIIIFIGLIMAMIHLMLGNTIYGN